MPNHDRWNDGEFALSDHLSHYKKNRSINLRGQSKHYWKWKFRERERERLPGLWVSQKIKPKIL